MSYPSWLNSILKSSVIGAVATLYGCASGTSTLPGTLPQILADVTPATTLSSADFSAQNQGVAPQPLEKYINENQITGLRSQVLNDMEAGVVALDIGVPEYAAAVFQDAYKRIETVYADNESAKAARSKFVPEANKDFKGEPYERAMLGYYMGMSDLLLQDIENAKVSFKWGEYQDTMSAAEAYQSDMALHNLLIGWATQCQGDYEGAQEHYDRAREYASDLTIPKKSHNLLLIAESGPAPVKYASGKHDEFLHYKEGASESANSVSFKLGKHQYNGTLAEDIYYQASTLGGRAVDNILAGKASFKDSAETTSGAAAATSLVSSTLALDSYATGNADLGDAYAMVGGLAALISIGAKIAADSSKPAADTRYWDNLPAKIYVATASIGDANETIEARFDYPTRQQHIQREAIHQTGACYLGRVRDQGENYWRPDQDAAWVQLVEPLNDLDADPEQASLEF